MEIEKKNVFELLIMSISKLTTFKTFASMQYEHKFSYLYQSGSFGITAIESGVYQNASIATNWYKYDDSNCKDENGSEMNNHKIGWIRWK